MKCLKVGSILKACRKRSGLSQEELAYRLLINQSDVSKYENDVKEPTISIVSAWAQYTQSQEVLVAFLCGVDGMTIMQQILEGTTMIGMILGGIF